MSEDFYQLLGVDRDADAKEIKAAYRKLALQYHPDRNAGDASAEETFKKLNEAYAVLSDPEQRARYDRFGTTEEGAEFSGDIFDIFASVFGGGGFGQAARRAQRGEPGEDLEARMTVTLEQAREGATIPLEIDRLALCEHCDGMRAEPGTEGRKKCRTCSGIGQVRAQTQSLLGTVVTTRTCPECRGHGEVVTTPCSACGGRGRTRQAATVDVALPKGIDGGYRLRIPRQGNAGLEGGSQGDLYVYIELQPHEHFDRNGDDLHYELPVGLAQATLGSSFEVPTMDGPEVIEIPAGTQPGHTIRMPSRGMPRLRGHGYGDQIVTVTPEVPRELSKRARELLESYAEEMGEPIQEKQTLVERLRGMFGGKRPRGRHADDMTDDAGEAGDEDHAESEPATAAGAHDGTRRP